MKRKHQWTRAMVFAAAMAALGCLVVACDADTSKTDTSETHFLETCDSTCSGGLECICGVCTKACDETSACGALSGAAECSESCSTSATPTKICDVPCESSEDCGSLGSRAKCLEGQCRKPPPPVGGGSGNCAVDPDPSPELPSLTSLDPDLVAKAATVVGSCLPDDGVDRNTSHVWEVPNTAPRFYARMAMQLECLANANCGCEATLHCLGFGYESVESCKPGCDGDVFTFCGGDVPEGARVVVDCGKVGMTCDPVGNCVDREVVACEDSSTSACNGAGEVEFCDDGAIRHGPVCDGFDLDCADTGCVGRGAECTIQNYQNDGEHIDFEGVSCAGDVLTACVGGNLSTLDCSTRGPGFTCQTLDGAAFCGLDSECVPAQQGFASSSSPPSCDGTVLAFCNAGRLEHVDCTTLGFTGCELDRSANHYGCTPGFEL